MNHRPSLLLPALLAVSALTACAGGASPEPTPTASGAAGHGDIAGAEEVAEPPLALLSIDATGGVGVLDLLSGEEIGLGAVAAPRALTSDGRYGFVTTAEGLEIVDSGRWSWNHGDHFHYYLAEAGAIGAVPGAGEATVTWGMLSTAGSTGIHFAGEAVLLDNAALSDGEIVETFRRETDADSGIVAPLGDGALVTEGDELVLYDASGEPTGDATECVDPAGAVTTVVGLAIGCDDGAVLATGDASAPAFEWIPYPDDVDAPRTRALDGRKGRPTVAGAAGATGFWLLDTRERAWQHVETATPLARVTAVDDADAHVVALDVEGRVRVYSAQTGAETAATEPLLADMSASVSLTVDGQRAYVNDPAAGVVLEIDYADGARVARTLETATAPLFLAEVGR